MFEYGGYLGLFLAAFGAATLLPMQSEAVLGGLLISERFSTAILLVVATTGNVLGSVVNWLLGRGIEAYREKRWFPVKKRPSKKPKPPMNVTGTGRCCSVGYPSLETR